MLLRLVAVLLVMMACGSEALETNFDCSATESEVMKCLEKPQQKKAYKQYYYCWLNYDISGLTSILKKMKTSGCIKTPTWSDVEAWLTISTQPKAYRAVYKNLTKAQKTTIVQVYTSKNNKQLVKKALAIMKVVDEKIANLSEVDKKEYDEYAQKYSESCTPGNGDSYNYS